MPIDFYYLEYSPPCRSVLLLAKAIGVHLNLKTISPLKGEHMKSEFVKVIPSLVSFTYVHAYNKTLKICLIDRRKRWSTVESTTRNTDDRRQWVRFVRKVPSSFHIFRSLIIMTRTRACFQPANHGILGEQIRQKRFFISERSKEERCRGSNVIFRHRHP